MANQQGFPCCMVLREGQDDILTRRLPAIRCLAGCKVTIPAVPASCCCWPPRCFCTCMLLLTSGASYCPIFHTSSCLSLPNDSRLSPSTSICSTAARWPAYTPVLQAANIQVHGSKPIRRQHTMRAGISGTPRPAQAETPATVVFTAAQQLLAHAAAAVRAGSGHLQLHA